MATLVINKSYQVYHYFVIAQKVYHKLLYFVIIYKSRHKIMLRVFIFLIVILRTNKGKTIKKKKKMDKPNHELP